MFTKIGGSMSMRLFSMRSSKSGFSRVLPVCCQCPEVCALPNRNYSYYKSKTEESPDKYTTYEKSFKEWKFVEKLIPPTHVPAAPVDCNVEYPSGWVPPNPPKDCSYVIRRTKNHMVPIYLQIWNRGQTRHTFIRKVEGNIWQLEKDIGKYLQDMHPTRVIIIRTNEISRCVVIKGDHVEAVRQWVKDQGF